jgi:hypothetical protein
MYSRNLVYISTNTNNTHFVGAGTLYRTTMNTKEQVNGGDFFCLLHSFSFEVKLPHTLYIHVFRQINQFSLDHDESLY